MIDRIHPIPQQGYEALKKEACVLHPTNTNKELLLLFFFNEMNTIKKIPYIQKA